MSRVIVAVLGNRLRGDDAAGPLVGDMLRRCAPGLRVVDAGADPLGVLDAWGPHDEVVVVDAAQSGAPPGSVHRYSADDPRLLTEPPRSSTHGFGLAAVLELARVTGRLPARLEIIGIEGAGFGVGARLHPAVRRAVAEVAGDILRRADQPSHGRGSRAPALPVSPRAAPVAAGE